MEPWQYQNGELYAENVPLGTIAAAVGTPCFVYSRRFLENQVKSLKTAFGSYPSLICYAVKANSHLALLKQFFAMGLGADIVSGGELARALKAGCPPERIVFSGVAKTVDEMTAALNAGILSFNVESLAELEALNDVAAALKKTASIMIRLNPNIDAGTDQRITTGMYGTKFGIALTDVPALIAKLPSLKFCRLIGLACHLGSQLTRLDPIKAGTRALIGLADELRQAGHDIRYLDCGGGIGIRYKDETPPSPEEYARALLDIVAPTKLKLVVEPGRFLIGNGGVVITRVALVKATPEKEFVIVDAGMNDVPRPAMYGAYHDIVPLLAANARSAPVDVVGPVCESSDVLGRERLLPAMQTGSLLVIKSCGAYCASMASRYNSRPHPPEVLVDGDTFKVIRARETNEDLWSGEKEG